MELKKTVLKFKFEDEDVMLRYPTVMHVRNYSSNVKNAKDDDNKIMDIMLDFLVELGLPDKFKSELEMGHIETIMSCIMPSGAVEGK